MKITKASWPSVKDNIANCSPELVNHLNIIFKKNRTLKTYIAEYKYGDVIAQQGMLDLPGSEQKFAFGLVLNGGLEVFIQNDEDECKVTTLAMLQPGNLLFLHEDLEPSSIPLDLQYVTAGARSIFFLAQLGDSDRLFHFSKLNNTPMCMPASIFHQWELFKALASARNSDWRAKVILFSEDWLNQSGSAELKHYLTKQGVPTPDFQSHRQEIDAAVAGVIQRKNEVHAGQILKNILSIAAGDLPGFSFAEDETFAPVKLIREAFGKDYGLELTELMQPGYIRAGVDCFYSFAFNSSVDQYARHHKKGRQSSLEVMRETQNLYSRLTEVGGWRRGDIYDLAKLEFLHAKAKQNLSPDQKSNQIHSKQSPFLRQGCILITPH